MRYQGNWTVAELIEERAERYGDRIAVSADHGDFNYGQLRDRAQRVAGGLRELGVKPGDRVATMLESTIDYLAVWHGISWAGAIDVPLNQELRGTFLQHVLRDSGATVIFIHGRWVDRLRGLDVPELRHVVAVDEDAAPPNLQLSVHPFAGMLAHDPLPLVQGSPEDVVYLLYTSGTTGPSKGVVYTNQNALWITQGYIETLDISDSDVGYSMFPLSHVMGRGAMATTAIWCGAKLILRSRFTVSGFWDDIRDTGTTYFGYYGAVILFLWREPKRANDADNQVRVAFGASAPVELIEAWEARFGLKLAEVYGSTELGLSSSGTATESKLGAMGRPVSYVELAVHDEHDRPVPTGTIGEIVARPRHPGVIFSGYWNRAEDTVRAFRNLWFHTGDAGRFDSTGYLTFTDRLKDSIRRRGENISSFEVEEAMRSHPSVIECAAYPVPSVHSDDEVMVAITLEPDAEFEPVSFFEDLVTIFPRYALPRYVRVVEEFSKTPSQRIQKFKLREEGITEDTYDREALGIVPTRD